MKRALSLVMILLILCTLLPLPAMAATEKVVRITNRNPVNVRKGPSKYYDSIGSAPSGSTYTYLGTENGWYHIQFTRTQSGYVYGQMAKIETVYVSATTTPSIVFPSLFDDDDGDIVVYVTNRNPVNVRTGPHKNTKAIASVKPRETYPYMGTEDGWHYIKLPDGRRGFVADNMTAVVYEYDTSEKAPLRTTKCNICHGNGYSFCFGCDGYGYQ